MRATIIDRYIFREIAVASLFCFAVFLVTGLIAGFLPLLQKMVPAGFDVTLILFQMLISVLPSTLVTILPLSLMIGILLGLGRMAADNEIAAVKSSGISVLRLMPPVVMLGLFGFGLSLFCTLLLIPKGVSEGRRLTQEALSQRVDRLLEERTFFDRMQHLIIYVEKIDAGSGMLHRIFINESAVPDEVKTIFARTGRSVPDPEGKSFILQLYDGTILVEDRHGNVTKSVTFEKSGFRYPLDRAGMATSQRSLEERPIGEMLRYVEEVTRIQPGDTEEKLAYYGRVKRTARVLVVQRFAYPMACIALAVMAFPLGVLSMGKSRLNNVSLGLVAMFFYYALTLAMERGARSGMGPPELLMVIPPLCFVILAAYLGRCVQRELIPGFITYVPRIIRKIRRGPK